jgi:Domain of unknown function (DUF4129)
LERQEDQTETPTPPVRRALSRQTRVLLVLVVLAAVIAVSTSAGGLGGSSRRGTAKPADLLWRVAVGAVSGGMIGAVVLAVLHRLAPSRPSLARWIYGEVWHYPEDRSRSFKVPADPSWRRALRRGLPLLLLLAAVGALIGASTAPLQSNSSFPKPSPSTATTEEGQTSEKATGRYVDNDGDGKPDEVQVDSDGDGVYESTYRPCPGGELPPEEPGPDVSRPANQPRGTVRIAVDENCDGTIDRYVDVRIVRTITPRTTAPRRSPVTTVPPSQANKVTISPVIGRILLALIAIAVVAAVIVGIVGRKRKPDEFEEPTEESVPDRAATVVAASVERSRSELVVDDDPRRAIIAAYQTLLDGLGAVGLPRRPQEAPEEYLRRSLAGVAIDLRPFQELTRLFGMARFSSHAITEQHRDAARQALADAAASLPNLPQAAR